MFALPSYAIPVELLPTETDNARNVADARQSQNLERGCVDRHGAKPEDGPALHFLGCCGEEAVAKHTNNYWNGNLGDYRATDAGPYEVRTTSFFGPGGCLRIHETDADHRVFVHVVAQPPVYWIVGWIYGWEAKTRNPDWFRSLGNGRPPAFWVPQLELWPPPLPPIRFRFPLALKEAA